MYKCRETFCKIIRMLYIYLRRRISLTICFHGLVSLDENFETRFRVSVSILMNSFHLEKLSPKYIWSFHCIAVKLPCGNFVKRRLTTYRLPKKCVIICDLVLKMWPVWNQWQNRLQVKLHTILSIWNGMIFDPHHIFYYSIFTNPW
jgi:hypothetical protein